jgi:hypothetical protein
MPHTCVSVSLYVAIHRAGLDNKATQVSALLVYEYRLAKERGWQCARPAGIYRIMRRTLPPLVETGVESHLASKNTIWN